MNYKNNNEKIKGFCSKPICLGFMDDTQSDDNIKDDRDLDLKERTIQYLVSIADDFEKFKEETEIWFDDLEKGYGRKVGELVTALRNDKKDENLVSFVRDLRSKRFIEDFHK